MVEETKKKELEKKETGSKDSAKTDGNKTEAHKEKRAKKPFKKNVRKSRHRSRPKPEFDSKIISIRRVTRVVAGGRRFSFAVSLVAGDRKGSVGVGTGKSSDTALAIEKAMKSAKKQMITLDMTENNSIPFDVRGKFTSSEVVILPATGRGLSAGSSVRTVLELAGFNDVTAKILSRSKNQLNNAKAAIEALKKVGAKRYHTRKKVAERQAAQTKKPR